MKILKDIYRSEVGKHEILKHYKKILDSWPVKNSQYKVNTSLGPTFIIESGLKENPPLILLHGSMSNSYIWYSDIASLSKSYNVYVIDIIGEAGLSSPNRPNYKDGAYALWLNEIINALKLDSCSIAAISLGGWIALSFATTYPYKVDSLILLCPGGLAREKVSFLCKAVFFSLTGKWGQSQILKLVGGSNVYSSSKMKKNIAFSLLILKYFKPQKSRMPLFSNKSLSTLTMPILMIFGNCDQLVPANKSIQKLKKFAQEVKIELLPNTGHLIINQADKILNFLKNNK